jgi:UDP-glucose:(glucosyl)LPS alpha-1,2-glucosyltransferase
LRPHELTLVATVLPPREGFSPGAVGAIGLVVHRLALAAGGEVVGRPVANPFADVNFHPAPPGFGLSGTSRYAAGVLRVLRRLKPDLVEVHNRPEIALRLARHLPRVVLFLHNDPVGMRGARTVEERARLVQRLAGIVTVSDYLRRRFGDAHAGAIQVLPNPVDVPPAIRRMRQRLILFMGRVVADKGADAFVAACASVLPDLPAWRAEMIGADRFSAGSPETHFLTTLRTQAAAAGVAMLGYRPHDEVMDRLGRASIAVVPSRWDEPFGLTALEALAHGTPLICSRRGGLPEVAGNAALYADPDAPGALAAAIASLATDTARRQSLAVAGRERARSFDTPHAAASLQAIRKNMMAQPGMQSSGLFRS